MNSNIDAYKIWAPPGKIWSNWAKPVMFANTPKSNGKEIKLPDKSIIAQVDNKVAIIIDLPGVSGVEEGLALASIGYRPVPLYNGVSAGEAGETSVPTEQLSYALIEGAKLLETMEIKDDAPPVFLLDSNRSGIGGAKTNVYDNRWNVFYNDFPTEVQLSNAGIKQIIVFADRQMDDLLEVLCKYKENGLEIFFTDGSPSHTMRLEPRTFWHRIGDFFMGRRRRFVPVRYHAGYRYACESSCKYGGNGYTKSYSGYSYNGAKGYKSSYKSGYSGSGYGGYGGGYRGSAG